jgi:hypothetical protein
MATCGANVTAPKRPAAKPVPTAEEKEAARKAADEKVRQTIADDQAWLDEKTKAMTPAEKDKLFRQLSVARSQTSMKDGNIILACPLPKKLKYCVVSEPFECRNGETAGGFNEKGRMRLGCEVPASTYSKLRDGPPANKIDGSFVTKAEGGSFRSAYIPWGPVVSSKKGKDGVEKVVTGGNRSGVTIGTGVDLGAIGSKGTDKQKAVAKKAYLDRLKKAGVSEPTLAYVEKFLGLQQQDACNALRGAEKYEIPFEDIEKIDLDAMGSRAPQLQASFDSIADAKAESLQVQIDKATDPAKKAQLQLQLDAIRSFDELSEAEQTILFSTYYHEGSITKQLPASDKRVPKPIVDDMLSGQPFRESLEKKSKDSNDVIAGRGKMELQYFDKTTSASPPAVSASRGPQPIPFQ